MSRDVYKCKRVSGISHSIYATMITDGGYQSSPSRSLVGTSITRALFVILAVRLPFSTMPVRLPFSTICHDNISLLV